MINKIYKVKHTGRLTPVLLSLIILTLAGCGMSGGRPDSISYITDIKKQDSIFQNLLKVVNHAVDTRIINDSLAFLIFPIDATCPSCRKKTIDSIIKYQNELKRNHFIIISSASGKKNINSYFREQNKELPVIENKILLDSLNLTFKYNLYFDKPVIYYSANKKVFKKVEAIPATVKDDLQEFFSGHRPENKLAKN